MLVFLFPLRLSKGTVLNTCEESVLSVADACIWKEVFPIHLQNLGFVSQV